MTAITRRPAIQVKPGKPAGSESTETTHYSVVDAEGNAVAVTYTLNGGYGNGITVPGLGFLLNNEMDDFAAKPGAANMFGLMQGEANAIRPGKRPLSAMTPTIILRDGKLFMTVGAPGGSRIITAVTEVFLNVADFGMNAQDAVDAPRFHHQWQPDTLYLEKGFSPDTVELLKQRGFHVDYAPGVVIARRGGDCDRRRLAARRLRRARRGQSGGLLKRQAIKGRSVRDHKNRMLHALSTHLFVGHRLTTVWLDRIWDAGIPLVEIFCAKQHLDYRDHAQISELGHWFRDSPLKLHSLHSPMYNDDVWGRSGPHAVINITEPVKSKRLQVVDEIKRALEIAEIVPFRYLIQHIGVSGEEYEERKVDAAFSALEEISVFARQRGVEVLIENTPNAMSSAERLLMFFEQTHLNLNVCLDTGHANHARRRGNRVPAARRAASARRTFMTIMGSRTLTCFRWWRKVEPSTGGAPWIRCDRMKISILCCWN